MNYRPNRTHWKRGALVLHDSDAKRVDMLMRVVGYAPNGRCQTEYVATNLRREWGSGKRSRLLNPLSVLHGVRRFSGKPWNVTASEVAQYIRFSEGGRPQ